MGKPMSDTHATAPPWRLTTPPVDELPGEGSWNEPTRWEPRDRAASTRSPSPSLSPRSRSAGAAAPADPRSAEIGYRLDAQDHELLVSCEPADALQQQFDLHHTEFVTVHDLGSAMSRRLLGGVATASRRPLQRLHIRRRGSGDTLAIIHFLELPTSDDRTLRFYTTEADAPPMVRHSITRALLANATMGAVMVSDDALRQPEVAFTHLHAELARPPWPNRQLLLLPMEPVTTLARELARVGQDLAVRHGLQVLTTPVVHRPSEAWLFLQSSFTRLKNEGTLAPPRRQADLFTGAGPHPESPAAPPAASDPQAALADTVPAGIAPARGAARARPAATGPAVGAGAGNRAAAGSKTDAARDGGSGVTSAAAPWATRGPSLSGITAGMGLGSPSSAPDVVVSLSGAQTAAELSPTLTHYLQRVAQIAGTASACIFEIASGRALAHIGQRPDPQSLARHGSALFSAMVDASRGLGLGTTLPDATLSLAQHHLIVRPVPGRIDIGLHLVLDRSASNLMLTGVQLQRLDNELISQPPGTV
jgi:hypothetical protein